MTQYLRSIVMIISVVLLLVTSGGIGLPDDDGLSYAQEREIGTNPFNPDTDGDGLNDSEEVEIGTNPTKFDTDSDGINDYDELYATEEYPNANPLQKDVYVEVDTTFSNFWMQELQLQEPVSEMKNKFASAPVENPDGSTGIQLHLYFDDKVEYNSSTINQTQYKPLQKQTFDNQSSNYYHIMLTDADDCIKNDCGRTGSAYSEIDGAVVEVNTTHEQVTHVMMHELGHLLGLYNYKNPCVDSIKCDIEEYPSVMNYKTSGEYYQYSESDWKEINNSLSKEKKYDYCMPGEEYINKLFFTKKECM